MCHDATINFFNPYILVFCRHNHDIKCILSGKAAKAAMFYITDYITKMDIKTHEMLSLMSKAVARTPIKKENEAQENAKNLLHKCLSQFSCQQQIHGQQAVHYLRGKDDTMMSHNTVPMLSSLLLSHIRTIYNNKEASQFFENEDTSDSNTENEPSELGSLKLELDKNGKLVENNQVLDYFYRDEKLSDLNFYNFARCIRMEKCHSINNSRMGTHPRYIINPPHRLSQTHELVQYINPNLNIFAPKIAVPRVIGSSIPRPTSKIAYAEFMLAHFKPFSAEKPLVNSGETIEDAFKNHCFDQFSRNIMANWEAIHECEDARDAEHIRK